MEPKPIHKVAILLWALAAILLVGFGAIMAHLGPVSHLVTDGFVNDEGANYRFLATWTYGWEAIAGAGTLTGLGTIIEILDRIRWNTTPK